MSKKIKECAESIKSKLSFDSYKIKTETPNYDKKTEQNRDIKVKCTFYIPALCQDEFETLYHKLKLKKTKVTRSDLIERAIYDLMKQHKELMSE